jgi:hypothetical protein
MGNKQKPCSGGNLEQGENEVSTAIGLRAKISVQGWTAFASQRYRYNY